MQLLLFVCILVSKAPSIPAEKPDIAVFQVAKTTYFPPFFSQKMIDEYYQEKRCKHHPERKECKAREKEEEVELDDKTMLNRGLTIEESEDPEELKEPEPEQDW